MTREEIELEAEWSGYFECRWNIRGRLQGILELESGHRTAIEALLFQLDEEEQEACWRLAQLDCPGMTREEYETELEATGEAIRKAYYSEKGYLKPRLVRNIAVNALECRVGGVPKPDCEVGDKGEGDGLEE